MDGSPVTTLLGILWIVAAAAEPSDPPSQPSEPPTATSTPDGIAPQESSPQRGILASLSLMSDQAAQQSICFSIQRGPHDLSQDAQSGAPTIHSDLFQVTGRMDTADRRGLAARAVFCDRRIDLSASEPAATGSPPTPVPGPGSVGVLLAGATLALRRRRRE
jgi:hypothetical protein